MGIYDRVLHSFLLLSFKKQELSVTDNTYEDISVLLLLTERSLGKVLMIRFCVLVFLGLQLNAGVFTKV